MIGLFQYCLLTTLRRKPNYSAALCELFQTKLDRRVSEAQMLTALMRMEQKAWVKSEMVAGESRRGGRSRRMFSVTPDGLDLVARTKDILKKFP